MTGFEWLVVAIGAAAVAWLVIRMNRVTPQDRTSYQVKMPAVPLAQLAAATIAKPKAAAKKAPAKKAPAKKVVAKKAVKAKTRKR